MGTGGNRGKGEAAGLLDRITGWTGFLAPFPLFPSVPAYSSLPPVFYQGPFLAKHRAYAANNPNPQRQQGIPPGNVQADL